MKKISLVLIVLAMFLAIMACGGDPSSSSAPSFDERCASAWEQMDVEAGNEGMIVNLILNNEWAPDSVGAALNKCIQNGWDGYR